MGSKDAKDMKKILRLLFPPKCVNLKGNICMDGGCGIRDEKELDPANICCYFCNWRGLCFRKKREECGCGYSDIVTRLKKEWGWE